MKFLVAIKFESKKKAINQLVKEEKIYGIMKGGLGVPKVYWFGSKDDFNILIMELLGPSLQKFFKYCWNRFSLKTVLMLAKQARTIEFTPKILGKNSIFY